MCSGDIVRVWFQKDPMIGYKVPGEYGWSILLEIGKTYYARPRIITKGGCPGLVIVIDGSTADFRRVLNMPSLLKSIYNYLMFAQLKLKSNARLSFFHAFPTIEAVSKSKLFHGYAGELYKVELSGIMQEDTEGELSASEMKVVKCLYLGEI